MNKQELFRVIVRCNGYGCVLCDGNNDSLLVKKRKKKAIS